MTASGRIPNPRTDTASRSVHEHPRREQRPGPRQRCPRRSSRQGEVVADVPGRHEPGDGRRPRRRARSSARPGARRPPPPLLAPRVAELERRCRVWRGRSSRVEALGAPVEPRAERLDGHHEDGREADDRSPALASGSRSRRRGCPTRSSARAGGRPAGGLGATEPRRPRRGRRRRAPSAAVTSGAAQSTAPFYRARRRPRRASRHTGPVEGYEASTYGDRFADVYDDWYGDVTDVDGLRGPTGRPGRRGRRRAGARARASGPAGWPCRSPTRGIEVHGIDASGAMLDRLRAKPGSEALTLTEGDMADLDLADPPPFAVVFVAFNTFFNLGSVDDQRRCLARVADLLAPDGLLRDRGLRPRRRRRRADRARRWRPGGSRPTRWC